MQDIVIYQPRWHDRKILIAPWKVGIHNRITFKYAKSLPDVYYLSGATIAMYPKETNGKALMHAVPLDKLELLVYKEDDDKETYDTAMNLKFDGTEGNV